MRGSEPALSAPLDSAIVLEKAREGIETRGFLRRGKKRQCGVGGRIIGGGEIRRKISLGDGNFQPRLLQEVSPIFDFSNTLAKRD